jgi:hypothetical protein
LLRFAFGPRAARIDPETLAKIKEILAKAHREIEDILSSEKPGSSNP